MFVYQKEMCKATKGRREYTVNLLTVRTPGMKIPGGSLLVGEILEDGEIRILPQNSSALSWHKDSTYCVRQLLRELENPELDEAPEETRMFAYFISGGWWLDVIAHSADEVPDLLRSRNFHIKTF